MTYAPWSSRVIGYLIDILLCFLPNIIAGVLSPDNTGLQVGMVAVSLTLLAYDRWYLAGRTGQSWGKRLIGLHLLRLDDTPQVGVVRSFLRDLAHLLDTLSCFLGWFWPLWDARRQTFADKLAATTVTEG